MFASSEHACDQWHSSRKFTPLTGLHCKLRPNTEGTPYHDAVRGEHKSSRQRGCQYNLYNGSYQKEGVHDGGVVRARALNLYLGALPAIIELITIDVAGAEYLVLEESTFVAAPPISIHHLHLESQS
jgi:hypothetical protein